MVANRPQSDIYDSISSSDQYVYVAEAKLALKAVKAHLRPRETQNKDETRQAGSETHSTELYDSDVDQAYIPQVKVVRTVRSVPPGHRDLPRQSRVGVQACSESRQVSTNLFSDDEAKPKLYLI